MNTRMRPSRGAIVAAGLALIFGAATLGEGGHVLFGGPEARAEAGNIVPFVLQFNFAAGFVYVLTGALTLAGHRLALRLAWALAAATLGVSLAFGLYVLQGGLYELRTVLAMTLRSGFWLAQALLLPRLLPPADPVDQD